MNSSKPTKRFRLFPFLLLITCALLLTPSCSPEAPWNTDDVSVSMNIQTISSGFVECSFSTNKDAYYLIAIMEPWEDYDPIANQKQFMQLALDSAYAEYLFWRNDLLRNKEFNVAPFSSHSLQYGEVNHFFTGLTPEHDYWVFAFPVNPQTMQPAGKLVIEDIQTQMVSVIDIRFDYRVKGEWDYIYPVDTMGNINTRFPYIAITEDSAVIANDESCDYDIITYFLNWEVNNFCYPDYADIYYGVKVMENNGEDSHLRFEEGHTYYTGISGFDGLFKWMTIYKFRWTKDCDLYFHDTDSTNLAITYGFFMDD